MSEENLSSRRTAAILSAFIDESPDAICIRDRERRLLLWNRAFATRSTGPNPAKDRFHSSVRKSTHPTAMSAADATSTMRIWMPSPFHGPPRGLDARPIVPYNE